MANSLPIGRPSCIIDGFSCVGADFGVPRLRFPARVRCQDTPEHRALVGQADIEHLIARVREAMTAA